MTPRARRRSAAVATAQSSSGNNVVQNGHDNKSSQSTSVDDKTTEDEEPDYEVEKVVDKKIYKNKVWYKLKWKGFAEPTWELQKNCNCEQLIKDYERRFEEQSKSEDEDEWEVEEVLDKRTKGDEVEYLLKWRNWKGDPTWTKEEDCECVNLIAAYENPKLARMWNFSGSNTRLWLDRAAILKFMRDYARANNHEVNILEFEPDFPVDETPRELKEGLNIGPLSYSNHWYLIIILVNYICTTKKLLICDPLNTLIGVSNTRVHPVYKRMTKVYPSFTTTPIVMTPMERSDTCAYHIMAAYQRALFCLCRRAKFIVNKLFFDQSVPELIRTKVAPETDHEISANLQICSKFLDGPRCEFCCSKFETNEEVNIHIIEEHFTLPSDVGAGGSSCSRPSSSFSSYSDRMHDVARKRPSSSLKRPRSSGPKSKPMKQKRST